MPTYANAIPLMRCHKRNGKMEAYVILSGERFHCGKWKSREAKHEYNRHVAEWLSRGRAARPPTTNDVTITECASVYLNYLEQYYKTAPSSIDRAKYAIAPLVRLYGTLRANDFSATHLRAVRETMINDGLARKTVNERIRCICAMFKHCASLDMVTPEPWRKATTLDSLRRGRSAAHEGKPIHPPTRQQIDGVLERVNRSVAAMIRLQILTGCRPGEVTQLKREDIDTTAAVWVCELAHHKTEWRGKKRTLYFGKQAQVILKEFFLLRKPGEYLFQPGDFYKERHEQATVPRRENQKPNERQTDRTISETYTTQSYGKSILHACRADPKRGREAIQRWTPNQLRHYAATEIKKQFGIEVTRAVLGHSSAATTELYAEVDHAVVMKIMGEIG